METTNPYPFLLFREDTSKKPTKYHRKSPSSHYKRSVSRSPAKPQQRKRSRSRVWEHEHEQRSSYSKYDKKLLAKPQSMASYKEEKTESLPQPPQQQQPQPNPANMYSQTGMGENSSSNLLNMALLMNQQLQTSSGFEPKPQQDFGSFHPHIVAPLPSLPGPPQQYMVAEPEPKKEKEQLVFGAPLAASNESNEGSYSHGNF